MSKSSVIISAVITSFISILLALAICRVSSWGFGFDSGAHLLKIQQGNTRPENLLFLKEVRILVPVAAVLGVLSALVTAWLQAVLLKTKRLRDKFLLSALSLVVIFAVLKQLVPDSSPLFTRQSWSMTDCTWQSAKVNRRPLIPSLLSQYKLIGMRVEQIKQLLGPPDVSAEFFEKLDAPLLSNFAYQIDDDKALVIDYNKSSMVATSVNERVLKFPEPEIANAFEFLKSWYFLDKNGKNLGERDDGMAESVFIHGKTYSITDKPFKHWSAELQSSIRKSKNEPAINLLQDEQPPVIDYSTMLLPNNRMLICGGTKDRNRHGTRCGTRQSWILDLTDKHLIVGPPMLAPRISPTLYELKDHRVLVVGDINGESSGRSCEIYDPTENRFVECGSLHFPRRSFSITQLKNGNVLIVGGQAINVILKQFPTNGFTPTAELLILDKKECILLGGLASRANPILIPCGEDNAYIVGGWYEQGIIGDTHTQYTGQVLMSVSASKSNGYIVTPTPN